MLNILLTLVLIGLAVAVATPLVIAGVSRAVKTWDQVIKSMEDK